jgi:hypothetical protein
MSTAETQHFPAIRNAANHGTTHATPARDKGNGGSHVGRGIAFGISSYTHAWFNFMPRPAGHRSLEQELRSFRESAPPKSDDPSPFGTKGWRMSYLEIRIQTI